MPDPYRKIHVGDKVPLSALALNAMVDAARAEKRQKHSRRAEAADQFRQGSIVRIVNETALDLPRYAVLGLSGPIFRPGDNLVAFLREVAFRGVTPTDDHKGRFAILLAPAAAGRIARAYVAGVVQVQVDVSDQDHTCAEADPGNTAALVSAQDGSAQIVWREGLAPAYGNEEGRQWAVVRFGQHCEQPGYYY